MIIISQRKHVIFSFASAIILLLLELDLTSGLQQSRPTSSVSTRRPISFRLQSTSHLLAEDDHDIMIPSAYDWDEQFEQLQSFMSEYGHCNFPQNPPKQLKRKYPKLKRFCHDQRIEYKRLQKRKNGGRKKMGLAVFDRDVRCRRLEELGFDFSFISESWYDSYHELIQYYSENGHIPVAYRDNEGLAKWVYTQRSRRNEVKSLTRRLSESQIKLLDNIGFEWKSQLFEENWNTNYKELVAFRKNNGHFMIENTDPLYRWMQHQRQRRDGTNDRAALTDEQIRLLNEIEFPWEPEFYDSLWHAMYDELQRFHKQHGHCQPPHSTSLYKWVNYQQSKRRKGLLPAEQIKLLDELDFRWESNRLQWPQMYKKLISHCNIHGHLQVSEDDEPDLYEWMATQRQRYHGTVKPVMLDLQIEKLEEVQFCWSLDWRERTWHEKYMEAVEFFKEHGHVLVTKKENPSLYNWIQTQGKRYKLIKGQKPLSEEELELLEHLDFPFLDGQPRLAWTAKYARVARYREENDGQFPTNHSDHPGLSHWVRQQRHRYRHAYGHAPLSDEQKSLLESIDFPMYPKGKSLRFWYERYDDLVDFWKQHGHFLVDRKKDISLYRWIDTQRVAFHGNFVLGKPHSKLQVYLLERIGFPWVSNRSDMEWQRNYDAVVEFLEVRGHFPRSSITNRTLYNWTVRQRKNNEKLSEVQIQQLEKIGFRW